MPAAASPMWTSPAVDEAEARRRVEEAYRPRVSTEMDGAELMLQALMQVLPPKGGVRRRAIVDELERLARENGDKSSGWRLPRKMEADEFLDHLVHHGALQACADGLYRCPIPSFRSWVAAGMPEPPAPVPPAKEPEEAGPEGRGPGSGRFRDVRQRARRRQRREQNCPAS